MALSRITVRRSLAAAFTTVLLAGATACGGDEPAEPSPAASPEGGAGTGSGAEGEPGGSTEEVAAGEEVEVQQFVDDYTAGLEQLTTAKIKMSMDLQGQQITSTGDVDYSGDTPAMSMKMQMPIAGNQAIDMILVDNKMYMNAPGMLPGGKWMMMDLADPKSPVGDVSALMDPKQQMAAYTESIKKVVFVGDEQVGGEDARHYKVTIDAAGVGKALEETMPSVPPEASSQLKGDITYDLWLDGDNRMRKMTMPKSKSMPASMEFEISDYGADVSIEAPPAAQVTTMPQPQG